MANGRCRIAKHLSAVNEHLLNVGFVFIGGKFTNAPRGDVFGKEDGPRPALGERAGATACRASLPGRPSGAISPAKDDAAGIASRAVSASVTGSAAPSLVKGG